MSVSREARLLARELNTRARSGSPATAMDAGAAVGLDERDVRDAMAVLTVRGMVRERDGSDVPDQDTTAALVVTEAGIRALEEDPISWPTPVTRRPGCTPASRSPSRPR